MFKKVCFSSLFLIPVTQAITLRINEEESLISFAHLFLVPSSPPSGFMVTASTSTSITASWRLPPKDSRNGIIRGFKLFINKKGSGDRPDVQFIDVSNASVYKKTVTGLQGSTEYELQVLAYTSAGDGPKSSVQVVKTKEAGKSFIIFRRINVL